MKTSETYLKIFNFETVLQEYISTSGNKVERQQSKEQLGLYKIFDKNEKMILLACKNELELFLFSWSLK